MQAYKNLRPYFGDLHSHCSIGYGHGSLEDAFMNARIQLDFAAVTVHGYWPDMPKDEERLKDLVAYHQRGFQKSADAWPQVQAIVLENNEPGEFVTFLAFEWHSNQFGDHNIYFKEAQGEILRAANLAELHKMLREWRDKGIDTMAIPHHIGYKQGFRGINWETFNAEFSPVVEIFSMHGASESPQAPYPYLHTMGPRNWQSMYQYGLEKGKIAGVIGSTDHHSAHPGSYGHGCLGVWSKALDRDSIWNAITNRRTYALTGDKIKLAFSVNDKPLGAILPGQKIRQIAYEVVGGGAIDYVEVLYNNHILQRTNMCDVQRSNERDLFNAPIKVLFEVGWANKNENFDWEIELRIENGTLLEVEPRFRGHDVVAPQETEEERYSFSHWAYLPENGVGFQTRTWGNPATSTPATQGISMEIQANKDTVIVGTINGQTVQMPITQLIRGPQTGYLGGFITPAFSFHRLVSQQQYTIRNSFSHQGETRHRDWYYLRARQYNGQWAWSSPIWVEAS